MNHHKIVFVLTLILAVAMGIFGAYSLTKNAEAPIHDGDVSAEVPHRTVCTADAMQCSDGSYVGRVGPQCEFAACPEVATSTIQATTSVKTKSTPPEEDISSPKPY